MMPHLQHIGPQVGAGIQQRLPDEQRAVRAAPLAPLQMPVGGPEP